MRGDVPRLCHHGAYKVARMGRVLRNKTPEKEMAREKRREWVRETETEVERKRKRVRKGRERRGQRMTISDDDDTANQRVRKMPLVR